MDKEDMRNIDAIKELYDKNTPVMQSTQLILEAEDVTSEKQSLMKLESVQLNESKENFKRLLKKNDLWLMERILDYAKRFNYTKYTSTLVAPWRISIEGLSESFSLLLDESDTIPEFDPDDSYQDDPASQFGLKEAKLHRSRGVNYAMFTSLLKYYRRSYIDLIKENKDSIDNVAYFKHYIHRFFDRVEIAYATEWNGLSSEKQIHDLSVKNLNLANEKNFYLTIFESLASPAFLIGQDYEVQNYNSAAGFDFNLERRSGHYYYNNQKKVIEFDIIKKAIQNAKSNNPQLDYFHKPTAHYYMIRTQELKDISDKFYGYVVLFNDTTELHKKDEMLMAQSRLAAMGEMLSMIAHQWRQPLSTIAMSAGNIEVDIELDIVEKNKFLDETKLIIEQTNYLSNTIDDFRNFFQKDKEKEIVTLNQVINEALKIVSASFEASSIEIKIEDKSKQKIALYSRELLQVFANILKNAKEALVENRDQDREVRCLIENDSSYERIHIWNNGGNIPQESIEKVFEPYFSTKDEKNGTGLGLYMSKMIIESHMNGVIDVKNTEEGVCFKISIPHH